MNKIEIEIPDGKKAEWVNGVLTLVDDKSKHITERIKTFEDACNMLGDWHPLVTEYKSIAGTVSILDKSVAYLKLCIICAALNEGWIPTLNGDECRYYPQFDMCTQLEYEKFSEKQKKSCLLLNCRYNDAFNVFRCIGVHNALSCSYIIYGMWLAFKTDKLAKYCGRQFISIWADYLLK